MRIYPFFLLAAVAIAGCDNTMAAAGGLPSTTIRVAGTWSYTDTIDTQDQTGSCKSIVNSMTLNQTNDTFNSGFAPGSQVCNFEDGGGPTFGPVTGGELYGDFVRFLFLGCTHTGTVTGDPPNRMVGVAVCSFPVILGGNPVNWSGTWEAHR